MIKKIFLVFAILLVLLGVTNVDASSQSDFIDLKAYDSIYKLSEDSDVKLPFVKLFAEKAIYDSKLEKSGLTIASKAVEIKNEVDGLQTIISSDTVDINGSMEYAVILATNVNISGTIKKDCFIIAESVFITEDANILGDVIIVSEIIEVKGNVQGNIIANSSEFLMEGNVGKDFRVHSRSMSFNETDIKGDIYIETDSEIDISDKYENAIVKNIPKYVGDKKVQIRKVILRVLISVILFTFLNEIIRKTNPGLFKTLAEKTAKHSGFAVIMGLVLLASMPIVATLAFICSYIGLGVVTTPLFIVYLTMIIVTIALAKFIVGSVIYEIINKKLQINNWYKESFVLAGIFTIIYLLCYIPYISWFVTLAIILLSSGIVVTGLLKRK